MGKTMVAVFFGLVMLVAGASGAYALQAGGVEIGDLDTGSVVGQPFDCGCGIIRRRNRQYEGVVSAGDCD